MFKKSFIFPMFLSLVFTSGSFANDSESQIDKDYFSIKTVKVVEVDPVDGFKDNYVERGMDKSGGIGEVIVIVDGLIAIGEKVYPIVEAGKPVLSMNLPVTHVIPTTDRGSNADTLYDMENWSSPKSRSWTVTYENFYGVDVVSFTYTIHFQYGGSHQGSGRYIMGAHVSASNVHVAWGFEFNAYTSVLAIGNRGSSANKVAGLTLKLNWVTKSIMTENRSSRTFHLSGNGELRRSY